ncbi:MAG: recombinase family protein [Eubacterium sp.]
MIAVYARQSVDKADSISIESQIEMCSYEAKGEPFLIYKDKGFSGKNTNRPEFQRMMQDIQSGEKEITKVIVYRLDRISRSILDFSNMMDAFGRLGVEFSSATEKFDTGTPMGRAMLNICITFAQLERETIQQRVKDSYISRSRKGFYMGGPVPVGFRKTELSINGMKTSVYVQVPEEVRLIRKVFEMYQDVNYSNEDIAAAVRSMPPECRRNRTVTRARIQDFIKNPVYVKADANLFHFFKAKGVKIINPAEEFIGTNGCYLYTGDKNTRKQTDLTNAVLVIAPHEGFIDSDLWIKCRERALEQQKIKRNPRAKNTWLAGLVKCGSCGYALVRKNYVKKNISYFLCSRKLNDKLCCGCGTINADEFENLIMQKIKERLSALKEFSTDKNHADYARAEKLKAQYMETENKIDNILNSVSGASETVMEYINKNIEQLHREKIQIQSEMQRLKKLRNIKNENNGFDWNELDKLPFERKRELVGTVIQKIYATENKIDIIWKL